METKHQFQTPVVTEVVPVERRMRETNLRRNLGRLSALPSLPDNVYILRPPVTPTPEAA
jgi:hypothetical protein